MRKGVYAILFFLFISMAFAICVYKNKYIEIETVKNEEICTVPQKKTITTTPKAEKAEKVEQQYKTETFVLTAYCACVKCCGKSDGITATGVRAREGVTVAADTRKLPFGTKIYIDGVGERIVQDRGGAIKGNRIDVYFDTHQEALNFGRQTKQVTILN